MQAIPQDAMDRTLGNMGCEISQFRWRWYGLPLATCFLAYSGGGAVPSDHVLRKEIAILTWNPVTRNVDGTTCTDLAGYRTYEEVSKKAL